MRVTFHPDNIKSVMLFVHRLTATERASIEIDFAVEANPALALVDHRLVVSMTLVRTTLEELKRFMRSVPGGEEMAETVKEVVEQMDTKLDDTRTGVRAVLDDTRTGYRITLHEEMPRPLLYDGQAGISDALLSPSEDRVSEQMKNEAMPKLFDGAGVTFTIGGEMPDRGFTRLYDTSPLIAPMEWVELLKQEPKPLSILLVPHADEVRTAYETFMYEMDNGPYLIMGRIDGKDEVLETGRMVNGVMKPDPVPQQLPLSVLNVVKNEKSD